jgi:hypothetical protein
LTFPTIAIHPIDFIRPAQVGFVAPGYAFLTGKPDIRHYAGGFFLALVENAMAVWFFR